MLLRDLLGDLCRRTQVDVFCATAARFTADLHQPPRLALTTQRVAAARHGYVRFRVDKPATVGMTIRRGGRTYLATSASVQHGTHAYGWWAPRARGSYAVTLDATDLAGNYARSTATLNLGR